MAVIFDSVYDFFADTARRFPDAPFIAVPRRLAQEWDVAEEIAYGKSLSRIDALAAAYSAAGYGEGDVVALAFESRPQHMFHYLALNRLGACTVPVNTDLTPVEIAYVLRHSGASAVVALAALADLIGAALTQCDHPPALAIEHPASLPRPYAGRRRFASPPQRHLRPAAILYTSGTTGNPKGCVLSNLYAQESGRYYASLEGTLAIVPGAERIMNPLPLYHMNSLMMTAGGVIDKGACLVLPGRFSLSNWWADIIETHTTRIHYLGIMIPALLTLPETDLDRKHGVKTGFGAGVDPSAHRRFEARFGIPLQEVWGMTETGRGLVVTGEPRHIDTRACGRSLPGFDAKILREDGSDASAGEPGELVVRDASDDPRRGFFSEYLDDPQATEEAWAGGWFHTGDICMRSEGGMFFFVDRRKNIVRRSGENISSAEVEAALSASPLVAQVAVVAVPDAMRDEEVLACVVLRPDAPNPEEAAASLTAHALSRLAYFKIPGWYYFVETLPTTGTQKIQKHRIFPGGFGEDIAGLIDHRHRKKRQAALA